MPSGLHIVCIRCSFNPRDSLHGHNKLNPKRIGIEFKTNEKGCVVVPYEGLSKSGLDVSHGPRQVLGCASTRFGFGFCEDTYRSLSVLFYVSFERKFPLH